MQCSAQWCSAVQPNPAPLSAMGNAMVLSRRAHVNRYVDDLAVSVAQREKIMEYQSSEVDSGAEAEIRMQHIMWRRMVLDEARQQTKDIDLMKAEVERLRQRTFPSFAKSYKKNFGLVARRRR